MPRRRSGMAMDASNMSRGHVNRFCVKFTSGCMHSSPGRSKALGRTLVSTRPTWKCAAVGGAAARPCSGKWLNFYKTDCPRSTLGDGTLVEAHEGPNIEAQRH